MNNWEASFDKISRRGYSDVLESLDVQPPFSFSFLNAESDLPDFLESLIRERGIPCQDALEFPGRDVALARDSLICAAKFFHVLQACRAHASRGAVTWAVVDSYHAVFMGVRALCALLGVIPYSIGERTVIVDFRPELGSPQDSIKFRKSFGRFESPIRILAPNTKHLEQKHFWKLSERMLKHAISASDDDLTELKYLEAWSTSSPGAFRNQILYDPMAWRWRDDVSLLSCTCAKVDAVLAKLVDVAEPMKALDLVHTELLKRLGSLAGRIGLPLEALPPAHLASPSPHVLVG